ncbi:hypothetical protein ADL22_14395 [Streptomyces sp. NRRL F-4489]|uniref:hypothetical protein n=1 Tax=Streptomyces sp. NRRL F-4489 TaxID=1609095 RepID=UPI0007499DB1|nr:hypothetical protein ADL22_14395 [Streptomyces sp. NRRL F-4489]
MHRHRTLCERAVDPLEIAAVLEADGVTDRAAARFRHRDVFSLAEELYARVPRADAATGTPGESAPRTPEPAPVDTGGARRARATGAIAPAAPPANGPAAGPRSLRAAVQLLPGAVALAALAAHAAVRKAGADVVVWAPWGAGWMPGGLRVPGGGVRVPTHVQLWVVEAVGLLLTVLAVRLALRQGPLRRRRGRRSRVAALWAVWAAGYALCGDWLLVQVLSGGPDVPGEFPRVAVADALGLLCAFAPAAWCAHWFAAGARRRLATSRGLAELARRVRPLLAATTLLALGAAVALPFAARLLLGGGDGPGGRWSLAAVAALGVLFFLARLLTVHGYAGAAAAGVGAAAGLEAAALALVLAARLPGLAPLGEPVAALETAAGPAAVPALACAAAALGLFGHALRVLTGACAHPPVPVGEAGDAEAYRP